MANCNQKKCVLLTKRIVRITFMVLIVGLLGLTLWGPFTYEAVMRWLPLSVLYNLSLLTKATAQIAIVVVVHFGIIGFAFHRLPKKNHYARKSTRNNKIAGIAISAVFIFAEALACFGIAAYMFLQKPVMADAVRNKIQVEISMTSDNTSASYTAYSNSLLQYAVQGYSCCGAANEANCSASHLPLDKCYKGASTCKKGCVDFVMERNVYPYMHTVASVALIVGAFAIVELILEIRKIVRIHLRENHFP